jgi:hypothetical protein
LASFKNNVGNVALIFLGKQQFRDFRDLGYESLTAVVMSSIFWDITLRSPLKFNRPMALLATCFHADFLFRLFFDPEDRGDMLLRNVG